jgi:hypothetical protein
MQAGPPGLACIDYTIFYFCESFCFENLEVSQKRPIFAPDNLFSMPQRECSMTASGT